MPACIRLLLQLNDRSQRDDGESVDAVALIGRLRSRRDKFPARVAKLCVPLSEAGYNFVRIESLNASGVPACRGSGVPCAIDLAGEAITDTKTGSRHHRLSGFSRRCIHSSSIAFTGRFLPSALNGILMICTDTVSSYFAIVQKRPRLKPICKELVGAGGRRLRTANPGCRDPASKHASFRDGSNS